MDYNKDLTSLDFNIKNEINSFSTSMNFNIQILSCLGSFSDIDVDILAKKM